MRRRASGSGEDEDGAESTPSYPERQRMDRHGEKVTSRESSNRAAGHSSRLHVRKTSRDSSMPNNTDITSSARSSDSRTPWPRDSTIHGANHVAAGSQASDRRSLQAMPSKLKALPGPVSANWRSRASRLQSPWRCSSLTLATTISAILLLLTIVNSFFHLQQDPKGCEMSYMMPMFAHFSDFDTEHTRFASKYSLYLYREGGVDEDTRVKGIPVLFIPGNAGSYKQVRPIAAEAAHHFHDVLRGDGAALAAGKRTLDFFTVDFNEEMVAFHGQTLLDQAEYLNEAVAYILALYHNPQRSLREGGLPDPKSVIILGHSMGGAVARTMLRMPNYQERSINTILTLSAPHARPPVSFDAAMVATYNDVNAFWRSSFLDAHSNDSSADGAASRNPLEDVTLVSVAGGGLDTMIPSEYTSVKSLVPDTHGFAVFTSGIPQVWTGMDHLAIMWCDQLRKALVRAMYDIVDVRRPSQTRPRSERITALRKRLLTGMEHVMEKGQLENEPTVHLSIDSGTSSILAAGQPLRLLELGAIDETKVHLLPIPAQPTTEGIRFTLLTDRALEGVNGLKSDSAPVILLCSVTPSAPPGSSVLSNLAKGANKVLGSTKLACKNAAPDVSLLPASQHDSQDAFDGRHPPLSYLQYDIETIAGYDFVAVLEKPSDVFPHMLGDRNHHGWLFAEFTSGRESAIHVNQGHHELLWHGLDVELPANRPLMTEIKIPEIHSSLFAYQLVVKRGARASDCSSFSKIEHFAPLLRQYIAIPYESKFFVNVLRGETESPTINVNVHGLSPYMPPPLQGGGATEGLALQIWTDPAACPAPLTVTLRVDVLGSAGKLVMRYRTIFAAFPLLVIALVLRKQFQVYDATGIFMSFTQSVDQCIRTSLPAIFLALTFFGVAVAKTSFAASFSSVPILGRAWFDGAGFEHEMHHDFGVNDLMLGTPDPFFWFLVPLFAIISVGICIAANYLILSITHVLAWIYMRLRRATMTGARNTSGSSAARAWSFGSLNLRLLTMGLLVLMVVTVIPYQFAYLVLCIVQFGTSIRALKIATESKVTSDISSAVQTSTPEDNATQESGRPHSNSTSMKADAAGLSAVPSATARPMNVQEALNYYNYTHSLLVLLWWILPINMPVLVVWAHNLAVHWLTPFATHHNLLAVVGYIAIVEAMSARERGGGGGMVPRVQGRLRHLTNIFTFTLALYAAVNGVTYAYRMHYLVNALCLWLALLHILASTPKPPSATHSSSASTSTHNNSSLASWAKTNSNDGSANSRPSAQSSQMSNAESVRKSSAAITLEGKKRG